jgi:hypothetical protein
MDDLVGLCNILENGPEAITYLTETQIWPCNARTRRTKNKVAAVVTAIENLVCDILKMPVTVYVPAHNLPSNFMPVFRLYHATGGEPQHRDNLENDLMKDKTFSVVICLVSEGELFLVGDTDPKIRLTSRNANAVSLSPGDFVLFPSVLQHRAERARSHRTVFACQLFIK